MRHRRADVVARALDILGEVGLPDLTMRRLGAELGVPARTVEPPRGVTCTVAKRVTLRRPGTGGAAGRGRG